ncbi:hypothetical protein F66182_6625 [Fusarium sp. NRRL 66182]|nr:hypothetical protein F66182_6625 [Fusarium sp. NRRL 66182]
MPPRPIRRSSRFSSREPEQNPSHDSPNALVRPQLPPLQGTPSSRRQYTYGSAAEPPPRVGAGLQRMDLSNAVNQALSKRDNEEEEFVRPPQPRSAFTTRAEEGARPQNNAPQPGTGAPQQLLAGSDADSSRSFGLESDYYEDASIGSAPASTSAPERRQVAPKPNPRTQKDTSNQRDSQSLHSRDPLSAATQPSQNRTGQQTVSGATRQTRQRSREPDEDEPVASAAPVTRSKTANTPAPNRLRQNFSSLQPRKPVIREDSEEEGSSEDEDSESEPEPPKNARAAQPAINSRLRVGSQEPSQNSFARRRVGLTTNQSSRKGLFEQADRLNARSSAFNRIPDIPDDPRERDSAIQQSISEAEDQAAREQAEREAQAQGRFQGGTWQQWLMQQYARLLSLWPFNLIWRRRQAGGPDDFDEEEINQGGPTEWWRLLNPMTYLQTLVWAFDKIMDQFLSFVDQVSGVQISGQGWRLESVFRITMLGLFALAIGGAVFSGIFTASTHAIPDFPDIGSAPSSGIHWPSPAGFVSRVGSIIPSISWPSWGRNSDDEDDPWIVDTIAFPDDHKKALDALKENAELHNKAIKRIESRLPRFIHMNIVNGRPTIQQEFWHALQDLLRESGSFLNLDKKNDKFEISSDKQFQAIVSRLEKDPSFTLKLNKSIAGMEDRIEKRVVNSWDTYFKNNDEVLQPLIEKAMAKRQSAGSGAEFDKQLSKIVNEHLKERNQTAVSRQDFLAHLENDLTVHRSKIQAEFAQLRSDMEAHIQESIRTAITLAPEGMPESEIQKIVRGIVYQAITDGSLSATAQSQIYHHWDSVLKHKVNFFGIGSGASIDASLTTTTWDPWGKGVATEKAYRKGVSALNPKPPIAALSHWQDEGDCWCAAYTLDPSGNPHGAVLSVQLAHLVVPQDIVIEHILGGATTDADARPRHIEVWARFEDDTDRERVRDYWAKYERENPTPWGFPSASFEHPFVKISQFEYQGAELHDGVHVQHISNDFINMGIPTDQVVIRAVSNHGAADHTCFYRVRLYGELITLES